MNAPAPSVLSVGSTPELSLALQDLGCPLRRLATVAEAMSALRQRPADIIVAGPDLNEPEVQSFPRQARNACRGGPRLLVRVQGPEHSLDFSAALHAGYDFLVAWPAEQGMLPMIVNVARRLRDLGDLARDRQSEVDRLRQTLGREQTEIVALLTKLLEQTIPHANQRRVQVMDLCSRLAARFEVPAEFVGDLELAAGLLELGRIPDLAGGAGNGERMGLFTREFLAEVSSLRGAAELVAGVYENWDGSGYPGHLRQGQIPLRARILRVASDFVRLLERTGGNQDQALEDLRGHSATLYDPLALVHLESLLQTRPGPRRDRWIKVAVDELEPGMVLAEDLYTESGMKLLARETVLTGAVLETIQRRHRFEPLVRGVTVHAR